MNQKKHFPEGNVQRLANGAAVISTAQLVQIQRRTINKFEMLVQKKLCRCIYIHTQLPCMSLAISNRLSKWHFFYFILLFWFAVVCATRRDAMQCICIAHTNETAGNALCKFFFLLSLSPHTLWAARAMAAIVAVIQKYIY